MPFITEEIWQRVAPLAGVQGKTIMLQPYPEPTLADVDLNAIEEMSWIMEVIGAIRTTRSERDIAPSKLLPVLLADGSKQEHDWLERHAHYLKQLARTESVRWLVKGEAVPESAIQLVGQAKVLVPLGSLINKEEELARLRKEIEKFEKELAKAQGKLANADFVARAPAHVVEQEKARVAEFEAAKAKLVLQRAQVEALPG
jgi:valyl-tRNA synthetase